MFLIFKGRSVPPRAGGRQLYHLYQLVAVQVPLPGGDSHRQGWLSARGRAAESFPPSACMSRGLISCDH